MQTRLSDNLVEDMVLPLVKEVEMMAEEVAEEKKVVDVKEVAEE